MQKSYLATGPCFVNEILVELGHEEEEEEEEEEGLYFN